MGVNAIRTAHNMPAPELMELADEMGFLLFLKPLISGNTKTTYIIQGFSKIGYVKT